MRKTNCWFVFVLCCLLNLSALAQTSTLKVEGIVSDSKSVGIISATVSLSTIPDSGIVKRVTSDKTGKFSFNAVLPGKYFVVVTAIGFARQESKVFEINDQTGNITVDRIILVPASQQLKEVAVIGKKLFFEQKADKMVVNVDASPSNAGTTVMDVLEKSPGVTVDKDDNISLKGKQGVLIMIDNKPTYMNAAQLASYLKSLPSSAVDQIEIMTNPSAKYDAAGNSGIINIKTKKTKIGGFNGNVSLTHTQGVYPKPSGSLNLNYRTEKFNFFLNGGYSHWEGFQTLNINRNYLNPGTKTINSIFTQSTNMKFKNPELNLKIGMDYFLNNKTTLGIVVSGFANSENNQSTSNIFLKDPSNVVDSMVYSPSISKTDWKNGSINLNFRRQFDSIGTELTADADFIRYKSSSNQYFDNVTFYPNRNMTNESILTGNLPSETAIYSFKVDYSHPFSQSLKFEAGVKSSYVETDNTANYFNLIEKVAIVDTTKTNRFLYHENINAGYINLNKQLKKWSIQAGLRLENTNYSGHQLGNAFTVNNNDSLFRKSYLSLFPTLYLSYQASDKNQFTLNYGRRIDRPNYQDLNPFLFFLDEYTYQAGNPYLQPQFSDNIEFSHTYRNFLTTTINYGITNDFFAETFEQSGHATIVRRGNIGKRENAGIAVSAQIPVFKWWTAVVYTNVNYNKFTGILYGENLNVSATTFLGNINNQFKLNKGWGAEISGFYRSSGIEGQVFIHPLGQASAAISKQMLNEKATIKLGIRDIFYTQRPRGSIDFQQTEATFQNSRDSRQVSISFTYRFGKIIKGLSSPKHHNGGASDELNRVKSGGNN